MTETAARLLAYPRREDAYAPLRDYAAIGDGRTVALVARDGAIDWLCVPNLDAPALFAAILDNREGGAFQLGPAGPFTAQRRYLPETNVLETTFHTATGAVRVVDALTLPSGGLDPARELVRRVDGLAGEVPLRWRVEPRFRFGRARTRLDIRDGVPIASCGSDALALRAFGAGAPRLGERAFEGAFTLREGERAVLALALAHEEPLVLPSLPDIERRLEGTIAGWHRWAHGCTYDGPWREAVLRSGLALKLLVHAPSGAIAAAATMSLPEEIGGSRNWDYRFAWIRDAAFTLDALLRLGSHEEALSFFWWLLQVWHRTHPRLRVAYRLDGGTRMPERELPLAGYRGSRPVREGNAAAEQLQLGMYGTLLDAVHRYQAGGYRLDGDVTRRVAEVADLVCRIWRQPDSGLWEVRSGRLHFTHSKIMCWVALDRALRLVGDTVRPARAQHWRLEAEAIRRFVDTRCWSSSKRSYVRAAGGEELDASLLVAGFLGFAAADAERLHATIDAVRRELGDGPLVHRYRGEDGLAGEEGAFVACSFWLAHALAHAGRIDEAAAVLDELVGLANDVGLYPEEIDPASGAFLGNLPQGLSHLALVGAATAIAEAAR